MTHPIKPTIKTEVVPILLIILTIVLSFYFYANFPEKVPTHWNYKGEIDSYSGRAVGAFLIPAVILGVYVLFLIIPYIDPRKNRYAQFAKVYHIFKTMLIVFMSLIYFYASLAGLGYKISINVVVPFAVGLMFLVIGNYMAKIKSNWFMGIRTPWTLDNEEVWNKTHRLGGKIFIGLGIFMILAGLLPGETFWKFFPIVIIVGVFVPVIYSFVLYHKLEKK